MDSILSKLHKRFPALPPNALLKIYRTRMERLRLLMNKGIPADLRWLIEAKVRSSFEFLDAFTSYMPGLGRSSYSKKRRAKRLKVCHKCAKINEACNRHCRSLGFVSNNREDKLQFIKYGLSRESLDNVLESLETHPSGLVQSEIYKLWVQFQEEHARYSLGNLTQNDPVCQFIRKLDGKHIPNS
jgi:hypothetical protein